MSSWPGIYTCLSDISWLELFRLLAMSEPIFSSFEHLFQDIQTHLLLLQHFTDKSNTTYILLQISLSIWYQNILHSFTINPLCITPFYSFKFYPISYAWTGLTLWQQDLSNYFVLQSILSSSEQIHFCLHNNTAIFLMKKIYLTFWFNAWQADFYLATKWKHGQNNVLKSGGPILPVMY